CQSRGPPVQASVLPIQGYARPTIRGKPAPADVTSAGLVSRGSGLPCVFYQKVWAAQIQLIVESCTESHLQRVDIRYRDLDQAWRKASESSVSRQGKSLVARLRLDKARLHRLAGRAIARYVDFVYRTSRVITEPADLISLGRSHHPFILAMWHGQFLMLPRIE